MKWNTWIGLRRVVSPGAVVGMLLSGPRNASDAEELNMTRPDLTGVVKDQDGKPLGEASVFIYTAGPKEGVGVFCPSCYADCRKRTATEKQGCIQIESLDPALLFRVLVVAKGHRPEFVSK